MDKTISIVLISGLLFSVLGAGVGFLYKTLQISPQLTVIKTLSSKTVPSMVAYGQVSKIEGRDITLSYSGDNINISMEENSPVYSFVNDSAKRDNQKKMELKDIKIGDNLNIAIRLLPDGRIQGQSVFILPAPSIKP